MTTDPNMLRKNSNAVEPQMVNEPERSRFVEMILEGERDIAGGRTQSASEVFAEIRAKYDFKLA